MEKEGKEAWMLSLCRDANVNATPHRGAALCSIHNAEVLIIMVMRGEIRPMQMRKDESARVGQRRAQDCRELSSRRVSLRTWNLPPDYICLYLSHSLFSIIPIIVQHCSFSESNKWFFHLHFISYSRVKNAINISKDTRVDNILFRSILRNAHRCEITSEITLSWRNLPVRWTREHCFLSPPATSRS